jgi:hypothetical protein
MIGEEEIKQTAEIIDDHFHNYETVFGLAAAPTGTHFGDVERLTPYVITSGNGVFGAVTGLLGTADTPVRAGKLLYDPRRISVVDVSNNTPFIMRFIWGTPAQTPAQAITALQYSDSIVQQLTANGNNRPQEVTMVRITSGYQLWAECKNATNLATVQILLMIHEYPSTSQ